MNRPTSTAITAHSEASAPGDRPVKVLVAASQPSLRAALVHTVAAGALPVEVDEATDGMAASQRAAGHDIVVIDLRIAGLGALGAIRRITAASDAPPVLAVDVDEVAWRDRAAIDCGASEVVPWPSGAARLGDQLAQLGTARSPAQGSLPSGDGDAEQPDR